MINGRRYDWESITAQGPQGVMVDFSEISYSDGQNISVRYGKDGTPRGYGRQNYEATGSISLDLEEWERLKKQLGKNIYDHKPFDITVAYGIDGMSTIVDKIRDIKLHGVTTSNSQGTENAGVKKIDFTALKPIIYNGIPAKGDS